MANAEKGEVSIQIDDQQYKLALTLNAMVALEEMFSTDDKPVFFQEVAAMAERGSTKHTRALMWALFQHHHKDEVTIENVSDLVQKAGGIVALGQALEKVMKAGSPDKRDLASLGAKGNPPKAQAARRVNGTGASSTSEPAASV